MLTGSQIIRPHIEETYSQELLALSNTDNKPRPSNWKLSPWAVVTYIMGGKLENGVDIEPKYYGNRRLMEIAVATLATEQALLLVGVPGTAKTWVSEHLCAAISGDSTFLVQGTAGMSEDSLRYTWNYARLLTEGPSENAVVPSPVMAAMQAGKIARIEELTRIPSDVQDSLITVLSEKTLPIPELNTEVQAQKGFNLIATANDKDKGVNELSSALRRRFNTVVMPLPTSLDEEVQIVKTRVNSTGRSFQLSTSDAAIKEIQRLVQIFRELRNGKTEDGRIKVRIPNSTLSTAEAISVINTGLSLAVYFGTGTLSAKELAPGITGTIVKNTTQDKEVWREYLETIVKEREGWIDIYESCYELL